MFFHQSSILGTEWGFIAQIGQIQNLWEISQFDCMSWHILDNPVIPDAGQNANPTKLEDKTYDKRQVQINLRNRLMLVNQF